MIRAYTRVVNKAYPTTFFMAASAHVIRDVEAGRNRVASAADNRPVRKA
jgi:hypothetical protein